MVKPESPKSCASSESIGAGPHSPGIEIHGSVHGRHHEKAQGEKLVLYSCRHGYARGDDVMDDAFAKAERRLFAIAEP